MTYYFSEVYFLSLANKTTVNIAACSWFASALFIASCWPRVRSVRQREQPPSVCLPGWADTVAAAQTADSCISLASSICYLETSDFITADQCSCTLWLSPGLSALSDSLCSCQSFSWAVSNWILAGLLIVHCAAFLLSLLTSSSSAPFCHQFSICLYFLLQAFLQLDLKSSICSFLVSFIPHHLFFFFYPRQFCCCPHVSVNSQYPLGPNQRTVTK